MIHRSGRMYQNFDYGNHSIQAMRNTKINISFKVPRCGSSPRLRAALKLLRRLGFQNEPICR